MFIIEGNVHRWEIQLNQVHSTEEKGRKHINANHIYNVQNFCQEFKEQKSKIF